jgi:DNA polymerase-3 subunit gamma/tau
MTVRNTIDHLKSVAEKEGISYEEEALAVIAEKSDGGMRDALSIFDQAASFCQGNITYQKVIEDLNVLDSENYFQIIDLSIINKVADIMVLLNNVINKGFDGGLLIQGLAKHVRNVLMAKDPQTLPLLEVSDQQRQRYQEQAQKCPTPFLYKALQLMNQCDINYRQSSNKRLLVELTLIEIAQITQPDEGPASGRKPRRLKSLFKQLIQQAQSKQAAPQVAAAEPVASTPSVPKDASSASPARSSSQTSLTSSTSPSPTSPSAPAKPTTTYNSASRPQLKSRVGFSWNNLLNKEKRGKMNLIPGTLGANDPNVAAAKDEELAFSQEDLELQWMSMCNRMPKELSGIATRMKNMNPMILDFPHVEVVVENQLAMQQMEEIKGSIVKTLKIYLHNKSITLSMRVAEHEEQEKILSRREQYELMEKENPSITKLRDLLSLELA